ncbi:UPF0676 protein C1494.01-like [Bradysia coprophila]|uniref:UPF0676 protein C1494.01-like n=1 Tax=Bradysia coprophila TaxID=38358 RepID=UPI00187DC70D|nr:UPF0676 protein C1494.01-like [Bradysia coprophila]
MFSDTIPQIDCSAIANDFKNLDVDKLYCVAQEFGTAMTGIGMCYLINHGLDMKKIERIYSVSNSFFNLPSEIKLKYRKKGSSNHGYSCPGDQSFTEKTFELKELWDISACYVYDNDKLPNAEIPAFQMAFDDIRSDLEHIVKVLLRCIEIYLNLERDSLISAHKNLGDRTVRTHTQMRSLYYGVINSEEQLPTNATRFGEHKDFGTLTFVIQDLVGGLEVKTSNGKWIQAVPVKNAILVNSGELLEYWTGGRFHAAPHRVRIDPENNRTNIPRQSFVYFVDPDGDTEIYPALPVLPQKENDLQHYNNKAIVAYVHTQDRIEASTVYSNLD